MPQGSRRKAAGAVLAVLMTAACTTATTTGDGEVTSSPSARVTANVTAVPPIGGGSGAGVRPSSTVPTPGRPAAPTQPALTPGMTPIAEASLCSVTRLLASTAPVQPDVIWPGAVHRGLSGTETVRRADPSCVSHQPVETSCDASFPYIAASDDAILLGLGAERLTTGEAHAEVLPPSGSIPSQDAVLYTVLHFPSSAASAADFESTRARLSAAVGRCAGGRPGHLGVDGLVGQRETVLAVPSFQYANFVFGATGHDLIWLVVDGPEWTPATRERAARSVISAITKEPTR
ncbi:MAG: hypothetical protein ABI112_10335 [Terracoccus sp.]